MKLKMKVICFAFLLIFGLSFAYDLGVAKDYYDDYIILRPSQAREYGMRVTNDQEFPINLTVQITDRYELTRLLGEQSYILEPYEKVSLKFLLQAPLEFYSNENRINFLFVGEPLSNEGIDEGSLIRTKINKGIRIDYKIEGEALLEEEIVEQEEYIDTVEEVIIVEQQVELEAPEEVKVYNNTPKTIVLIETEEEPVEEQEEEFSIFQIVGLVMLGILIIVGGAYFVTHRNPKEEIEKPIEVIKKEPIQKEISDNEKRKEDLAEKLKKLKRLRDDKNYGS